MAGGVVITGGREIETIVMMRTGMAMETIIHPDALAGGGKIHTCSVSDWFDPQFDSYGNDRYKFPTVEC